MGFDQGFLDYILEASKISEIIGERITVKKKGSGHLALCPFHADTKPSLHISDQKKIFKCFACGKGGNAITFLMEFEKLTFPDAVKSIASKYGIALPRSSFADIQARDRYRTEKDINAWAAELFHKNLFSSPAAQRARNYCNERKLGKKTCRDFLLGYAPDDFHYLQNLLPQKFPQPVVDESSLLYHNPETGRTFDFFRSRLMFPIFNERDEIIGFGGRIIGEGEPKYINSRETGLFQKKNNLYGLNRAYSEITRQNEAVVVEGYMDVIACHQHGIPRAVAPLGTALTREQIIKLKRYSRKIILLFDGDSAGQAAARRAAPLVMEAECEGFVLVLPDNLDPFDYLNKYGTEAFLNYKKEHEKNIYDFLIESTIPSRRLSADEKSNIYRETLHPLLKAAHNPLVHDEFLKKICQALDTPREVIDRYGSELDSVSRPALIRKTGEKLTPEQIYRKNTELDFAVFLCKNPSCAEKAFYIIDPAALQDPAARLIYSKILDISGRNPTLLEILGLFSGEKIREFITEKIHKNEKKYSPEQEDGIENLLDEYIYKIKKFQLAEKLAEISLKIREAGFSDDDEMKKQLLEEKIYLINEREKLKKIING